MFGQCYLIVFLAVIIYNSATTTGFVYDVMNVKELEVPVLAEMFRPVRLGCWFRLGEESRLEYVKWFKDGEEFYRFQPNRKPNVVSFPVPGAKVVLEESDVHTVKLENVTRVSGGLYRCEVSTNKSYRASHAISKMEVFARPNRKPEIQFYNSGSRLEFIVICTSGESLPKQKLTWEINGQELDQKYIEEEKTFVSGNGLLSSYSKLHLKVGPDVETLLLTCVAQQEHRWLYTQRAYAKVTVSDRHTNKERYGFLSWLFNYIRSISVFIIFALKLLLLAGAIICMYLYIMLRIQD